MNLVIVDNSLIMSSSVGPIDRTKLLTPSLSTDDKPSSIDISTSSSELSPKRPHSSTLPSEQSQTKGRLTLLSIDNEPSSVDISTSSSEHSLQLRLSTLPSEQYQTKGRLIVLTN